MTPPPLATLDELRQAVDGHLARFLAARAAELTDIDPALEPVGRALFDLVTGGGKRLRPAFVYWGHRATGAPHDPEVLKAAAAVELLHAFALVHDDIMDRSPSRRGMPAVHERLAARHTTEGLAGDPFWFGVGGGILAGDLLFVWADQLLEEARLDLRRARQVFIHLRVEVMAGQYLDLRLAGLPHADEEASLRVSLLKSGRYTVTRPLQLGAALAAADPVLDRALSSFGDAVGIAFQLRDDVLGLFGEPETTGKGALEDLREGKRTLLVLKARARARGPDRALLDELVGCRELDWDGADRVREVVRDSGALEEVEALVDRYVAKAARALVCVPEPAASALRTLAESATQRRR